MKLKITVRGKSFGHGEGSLGTHISADGLDVYGHCGRVRDESGTVTANEYRGWLNGRPGILRVPVGQSDTRQAEWRDEDWTTG